MRKNIVLISVIYLLMVGLLFGQSSPGDIAFIAANVDGGDDFAFVTLVDIPASTSIYFTDNEWNGTAFADLNEGELTWTNGESILTAGSVVVFTDPINTSTGSVNVGTVSGAGWNLGSSDEWFYALLSAPATSYGSAPTFLAAMASDAGLGWLTGTGLTDGTHAIDFDNDYDGFKYTGSRSGESSFAAYLTIIYNSVNWQDETSDGELILPISTTAFTVTGGSTPTITLSESSLTGFSYVAGNGPSSEQSFTTQGSNLTADITLTAPTNYEISESSGTGYTTPITLTQSGGSVSETTIYVRLKTSLGSGDYNAENISATSTDATTRTVTCSGTVYKIEPTNHVTGFSATKDETLGFSRIDLAWTENDGAQAPDGYLIKASTSDNVSDPVDGTAVSDNLTVGDNNGAVNIAHSNSSYEWAGLSAEQTYYFKIYPYTNSGSAIDYKTAATVPGDNATTEATPAIPELMISEVADPGDVYQARFVELYNASGSLINFGTTTFYLAKQSNGGSWGNIQLTGTLTAGDMYIIAYSASDFNTSFSFAPDLESGIVSGNGNDGYFIYYGGDNSTGTLVDAYGVINEDGSGKAWDYLDSRAVRSGVDSPNTTWTASEWVISSANVADCTPGVLDNDQSLPVELSAWKATSSKGIVKLLWSTDSEIENQGFIIERSQVLEDGSQNTRKEISSFSKNPDLLGQGSTSAQNDYSFIDKQVKVGKSYSYRLSDVDYRGNITRHAEIKVTVKDAGADLKPSDVKLHKAFPNPFNPDVNLSFTLENEVAELSLEIYDIQGALVQTLSSGYHEIGNHDFKWNGFDTNDHAVSSGVYMVRLSAGSVVQIQRVTLLR